jgi:hypothetical protein
LARSQDKNYACCIPEESTGLFDLVTGLPLHPLINHVVVVMVPLAVVTMVLVIIARGTGLLLSVRSFSFYC